MNGYLAVKKGYWYTVINYKDYTGKIKKKWEATGLKERNNKKEATKLLDERLQTLKDDLAVKEEKIKRRYSPVDETFMHRDMPFVVYLGNYIESIKENVTPYVFSEYSQYYIKVYKAYFKDMRVIDITHEDISGFNDYLKHTKKLSSKTISNYSNVLRPALKKAFLDKVIPDNPYDRVKIPRMSRPIVNYYNKEEISKLFEATQGHKLDLVYKMFAYYGLRRSELLGLKWKAIDFDHDTISINHKIIMVNKVIHADDSLKTKSSNRTLPLLPNIKVDLIEHKKQIEANKTFFGSAYNKDWEDYIFVNEQGEIYKPDYISKSFFKIQKKHKLKKIRLHDLRHSCASLLLANGINLKQIQDWLGHADFSTTANVYSHLDFSTKIQSANTLLNVLNPAALAVKDDNLDKIVVELTKETIRLGFSSLDEYLDFRDSQKQQNLLALPVGTTTSKEKNDFEM